VSDGLRRMKIGPEVNALDRHVRGEDQFLPGREFHERGIIANTQTEARRSPVSPALEPGNEFGFVSEGRFVRHVVLESKGSPNPLPFILV
jgi:hypothetical protein